MDRAQFVDLAQEAFVYGYPMVDMYYVQHESPGQDRESNWLPVPRGKFILTFRCYQPGEAILNHTYTAPPVVRVS